MAEFPIVNGVEVLREAPEGYVVDFENPENHMVMQHYLVFAIGGSLAFITLIQRFYTKIFLSKGLQTDDAFMFLGWICSVTTQAGLTYATAIGGFCHHTWEQPLSTFREYSTISYVVAAVYMMCNGFTKLSLLTFYLQLSPQRWFRIVVWCVIGLVAVYTIIITCLLFFYCSPPRAAFDPTVADATCMDAGVLFIATAVSNVVTDVILFILPIRMILQLRMPMIQKVGAILMFAIGSMTVATSVIRLAYLPATLASDDISWDGAPANVWTFVEANLFIICGSMPTLRKFLKHFAPRLMGSSSGQASSYGDQYRHSTMNTSRAKRRRYEQFPGETELQDFEPDRTKGGSPTPNVTSINVTSGSEVGDTDNHSEKAILQTKTVTVTYD